MKRFLVRVLFIAIFGLPLCLTTDAQAQTTPQGDPQKGSTQYGSCRLCHGTAGAGGFGPDLAGGRVSTFDQFKRSVREPWGVMPALKHIDDEGLANIYAYLKTLKPVPQPGAWSVTTPPAGAPLGQVMAVNLGCGQCHGPELGHPRRDIGGKGIDYEHFKQIVWGHGPASMGTFKRERFSEPVVKELWDFMSAEGFRALLFGSVERGETVGDKTTYTITVDNRGPVGKGLTPENITITLPLPKDVTVAAATGRFDGVRKGEHFVNPAALSPFAVFNPKVDLTKATADLAVWKVAKVAPGQKHSVTLTLSGPGAAGATFTGTTVAWTKPAIKRIPGLQHRDERLAEVGDIIHGPSLEMAMPPAPKPAPASGR
jgi:uncharacterized repeat protein (TIGR01451 family)